MVRKNLFSGQQWRNRHREQTYGYRGREGRRETVRCMERVTWKLTLPHVKCIATGICYMAQKTHTEAVCHPRGLEW